MKNKQEKQRWLLLLLSLIVFAAIALPLPYYVEAPGSTIDLKELITVNNKTDQDDGSFSLTAVGVRRGTAFQLIKAKFSQYEDIVSKTELTSGASTQEYDQMQQYYMTSSQNAAIEQALKLADYPYEMQFLGVYVLNINEESNFINDLSVGDTITQVDGQSFENHDTLIDYIKSQEIGQKVTITYLHDGEEKTTTQALIELPTDGQPGIGIGLTDHTEIDSSVDVEFETGSIGGPSAGLMFTLEIYQQLTGTDLRQGKKIAGTGTMSSQGEVGRIGGIDKKVVTASQNDVEIFFAPDDEIDPELKESYPDLQSNYEVAVATAKDIKTDMIIVPVKTVADALNYLENM